MGCAVLLPTITEWVGGKWIKKSYQTAVMQFIDMNFKVDEEVSNKKLVKEFCTLCAEMFVWAFVGH